MWAWIRLKQPPKTLVNRGDWLCLHFFIHPNPESNLCLSSQYWLCPHCTASDWASPLDTKSQWSGRRNHLKVSKIVWDSNARVPSWKLRGVYLGSKPVGSAGGLCHAKGAQVSPAESVENRRNQEKLPRSKSTFCFEEGWLTGKGSSGMN